MLRSKEAIPSSPYTQLRVPILAVRPAQTFVQSGQAGMRQNRKPAQAEAITETKHSNHNLDLKINSRRGRQDSLPHTSICLEEQKNSVPSQRSRHQEAELKGQGEWSKAVPAFTMSKGHSQATAHNAGGQQSATSTCWERRNPLGSAHCFPSQTNAWEGADSLPSFAND